MIKNIQIIVDLFREIWQYIHRIPFVEIGKMDFFCMDFGSIERMRLVFERCKKGVF